MRDYTEVALGFNSPPNFAEVPGNQIEVCQRRARNRLLVLPGNLEQPSDAVDVLGGE